MLFLYIGCHCFNVCFYTIYCSSCCRLFLLAFFFPFMTELNVAHCENMMLSVLFLRGLVFAMFLYKVQKCLSVLTLPQAVKAIKSDLKGRKFVT